MQIGGSGQNGEHVPINVEAKKYGQEIAPIQLLLMVGVPALAMVVKLKVLFQKHNSSFDTYFILLIRLWKLDFVSKQMLQAFWDS